MLYLLGIDLGTSSVKSMIMNINGDILGIAQEEYPINTPVLGYAEQHPAVWWEATVNTIKNVLFKTGIDPKSIKGIGLSGQMHGMVLLAKDGIVLRPAIIWCDQRSKAQVDEVYEKIGKEKLGELTLNPIATGFQTASMLWIKQNEPHHYERTWKVILPKDYIRFKLTGLIATDITDASGTLAFDTAKKAWCGELIEKLGLDMEKYPEIGMPSDIAGAITNEAAEATGLTPGTVVVLGGGDQPMQAVGNGIILPGTVSATIGTGGQIFTPVMKPAYDTALRTHTFCHAVENVWNIMGASLCAGLSLRWYTENVLRQCDFESLSVEVEKLPPGSEGLIFLPYLTGERTPHLDPFARGIFFGLTLKHNRNHLARAIMEGVAFALRDSLEIFKSLGIRMDKVIASGGGAKSKAWLQIQADVFQKEIYTVKTVEQACVGAAIVAGVGTGIYTGIEEGCKNVIHFNETVTIPLCKNAEIYDHHYNIYKEIYIRNKDLFVRL